MRDGVLIARRGIPAVALVTDDFWAQGDFVARSVGLPDLPRVRLPHPVAGTGSAAMAQVADDVASTILDALAGRP